MLKLRSRGSCRHQGTLMCSVRLVNPGCLSFIQQHYIMNAPLRSLTVHPRSSKMFFPVTPWIKKTHGDLQMLPSSRFQFRAFKTEIQRKLRAWFLLPCRAVSVSGAWLKSVELPWGWKWCKSSIGLFDPRKCDGRMAGDGFISKQCPCEAHAGVGSSSTGVKPQRARTAIPQGNRKFRQLEVCGLGAVIFLLKHYSLPFPLLKPQNQCF